MDEAIRAWVEAAADGRVTAVERPQMGGSRELWFVDVEQPDGTVLALVVRCEAGGSFTGTEISPAKEAAVYRALEHTAVPVPRVIALAPDGSALLLERVSGTGSFEQLDEAERVETLRAFVDALAELHRLDVDTLGLSDFPRPHTPEQHAVLDLELWARLADDGAPGLDPIVRYAGAWLRAHAPTAVDRTVLVQGDTGPGNFVSERGVITGIVDWEFAHLGDPMDDWAWLLYRCPGVGRDALRELQHRYTERSGIAIDPDRVRYYELAVQYRCAVTTSLAVSRGGGARGLPPYLLVTEQYVLGVADRLSALTGVSEVVEPVLPFDTERTPWYRSLVDGIRAAARGIDDPALRAQTRNLQILVHYLRGYDAVGREVDARDRADRAAVFGDDAFDREREIAALEDAGARADEHMLRYLLRRTARERLLWASLLDRVRR